MLGSMSVNRVALKLLGINCGNKGEFVTVWEAALEDCTGVPKHSWHIGDLRRGHKT